MRIAVTGSSGMAEIKVAADFKAAGFDFRSVDIEASPDPDQPTPVAELTDFGQTVESLSGVEAVVHVAAIPAPTIKSGAETFRVNMNRPSADLIVEVFPDVPVNGELSEYQTLLAIDKATAHLGYAPGHSRRGYLTT